MNRRLPYGVSEAEVKGFAANKLVGDFLGKFEAGSWFEYARHLAVFFKWLRVHEGLKFTPESLLNEHLRRRGGQNVEDRRWLCSLVLKFCRDNPDFAGHSDGYKYGMFMAVKGFFDFHEVPLTTSKGLFGSKRKLKNHVRQFDVAFAKRILGTLHQREKAICLCMFQSGQSIDAVLNRLDFGYLKRKIDSGASRIRLDFDERKGNDFNYFTFISTDAIQELRKWFIIRESWLQKKGKQSNALWITRSGKPLTVDYFEIDYARQLRTAKIKDGPFTCRAHMFRKLFKTLSSPPELGINGEYIEFMMGHESGIQGVGGVYDRTPEINETVVEREFAKLEPYLNVYSGVHVDSEEQRLKEELFRSLTPDVIEWILEQVKKTKQTL